MNNNHAFQSSKFLRALLVLFFMTVSVQWTFAQLNLNVSRTTLGTVIEQIKSQSKYQFFYDDKLATMAVENVKVKNASIEDALNAILKGKNISFKVEDNIVYLSEKSAAPQEGNQQGKERTITGQVSDDMGPLIGVNVLIKGTSIGGITDLDGNFTLTTTEANPVVQFSYVGYKPQEIAAKGQNAINVMLETDSQLIEEVVVTALGIKRATKALSYNVQEVKSDEITRVKDANFVNSLNGKVAGVNINASSSGVGGVSKVVMRGTKSIMQSSNALYVIDGVPMYAGTGKGGTEFDSKGSTEPIADINPEDIESMSVLTGAAAAALYGSDAANGAIVITTKKGKEGRVNITVNSNTEIFNAFVTPDFQNRYGTSGGQITHSWGNLLNSSNSYGYNPTSDYFQTGVTGTESISLSTGTDKNQTYVSAAAVNSKGLIPNNKYARYNFTFRNTTSFLDDKMTLDVGATYVLQKDQNMVNQGTYNNPLVGAYLFPRGNDWEDFKMYERYDASRKLDTQYWPVGDAGMVMQNPYWINYRQLRNNNKDRYMLNASLNYKILDWLSVSGRVRLDNSFNDYTEKYYAGTNTQMTESSTRGLYTISKTTDKQLYADFLININKSFGENWNLSANIGTSFMDMRSDGLEVRGPIADENFEGETPGLANVFNVQNLSAKKTKRMQNGWREQTQSVFASAELGYKSTYYLTLTGRNDWASQLANSPQKSFFYPSVGVSWLPSSTFNFPEKFNYLKIRASYAKVGDEGDFDAFQYLDGYTSHGSYIMGSNGVTSGMTTVGMANPWLTWYESKIMNIGFEASYHRGLISVEFDWFRRNRSGLPATRVGSLPTIFGESMPQENLNSDINTGFEIVVGHKNRIGNFNYNVSANFSTTRIKYDYVERAASTNMYDDWRNNTNGRYKDIRWGKKVIGQFTSFEEILNSPVQDKDGNRSLMPGDLKFEDYNGDGIIDDNDTQPLGHGATPRMYYGLNMSGEYKGFDLTVFFQGAAGHDIYVSGDILDPFIQQGLGNGLAIMTDRWHREDPTDPYSKWIPGYMPAARVAGVADNRSGNSWSLHNANYLRLKTLELGYTLPKVLTKKAAIDRVRFYINCNNLLTFTKRDGLMKNVDPESNSSGIRYYPQMKTYNFGVNVTF